MKILTRLVDWVIFSSADPYKTSLSVKMALLGLIPYAITSVSAACGLGLVCLEIGEGDLEVVVNAVASIILWGTSIVSSIGLIYGVYRKITLTLRGENKVLLLLSEKEGA